MIYITTLAETVVSRTLELFFGGIMRDIVMHGVASASDAEIPDLNYIGLAVDCSLVTRFLSAVKVE